ncbi:MAG TPA: glycosyltransferase family 2 protein [Devosiaceae bacterium]
MPEALALLCSILGEADGDDEQGKALLSQARATGIDPLELACRQYGLSGDLVHARASALCGLAFARTVPNLARLDPDTARAEQLGDARTLRGNLLGREVVFISPTFEGYLDLAARVASNSDLGRSICAVPPQALRAALLAAGAPLLTRQAQQRLAERWPRASGHRDLSLGARIAFLVALTALVTMVALAPFTLEVVLTPLVAVLLLVPAMVRMAAAMSRPIAAAAPARIPDRDLPVYSVLIPLRSEAHMVPQIAEAMRSLNYPPEKLEVIFAVEETSSATLSAVSGLLSDHRFQLFAIPDSIPRTKPKALNYVLPFVRGEYLVVYDAEDIPDPGQLRDAAARFATDPALDCLQAELVVENGDESWRTALYAAEYAGQFGIMLPFLARHGFPIPLGGNSNHFRTRALREVGGWDPYNVTEDADLGVRLSRLRYRTQTLASQTLEEAPVALGAWVNQRTRWLKGWMQTFIVHNRNPRRFLADIGWRNFLAFEIYVGGLILAGPLHTVFLLVLLIRASMGASIVAPNVWMAIHGAILLAGYLSAALLAHKGLARLRRGGLAPWLLLLPAYWILTSYAAIRAMFELLSRPHFWAKTPHRTMAAAARHGATVKGAGGAGLVDRGMPAGPEK